MNIWMIYGANGYTGVLIAEEAIKRGMSPILAGRREEAIRPLARRLGLEYRIFPLNSPEGIAANLTGVSAVLLTAGPFSETARPVLDTCIATGTHYMDITGEIEVFELCHTRGDEARKKGCVVLPGVGMDVVPTDCLAAGLKSALPDADRLEMAYAGMTSYSRGTMKTMVEGIPKGGAIRENGQITRVPLGWKTMVVPFRDHPRPCVTFPWGDVSTAYYSTGIPNIVFYAAMPGSMVLGMRLAPLIAPLLKAGPVQRVLKGLIGLAVSGPDEKFRAGNRLQFWGRVTNKAGRTREGTLETPNSYHLTVLTSIESVVRVTAGKVSPGFHTPSTAFGAKYITEFPGCDLRIP